ncbi:MAG: GNAT family N-acetyltransferase [Pseudorhodoplanes sp.]|nr:GNAT family N-acetyltransferase [Pseudorhodoplanes sp.]
MPKLSQPTPDALIDPQLLQRFCKHVRFGPGEVLREKGLHYRDMYWLADGCVDVVFNEGDLTEKPVRRFPGSPVGEIGFLRGWPATATVSARITSSAYAIDDSVLERIEREEPLLFARLLQVLAEFADQRTGENLTHLPGAAPGDGAGIEVLLCRDDAMLAEAQRLRYEVYCGELRRASPYADHDRRIITDSLDKFGHTFIAREAGETIGTLRANISSEGPLGAIEDIYGMRTSALHPLSTGICTKFVVKKARRRSPAAIKLIGAMTRFGARNDIRECYIDCVPALLPYYRAMGFEVCGPAFFHRENGPSHPMKLDLVRYGPRLSGEFGLFAYLSLYLKARAIRLMDRLAGRGKEIPAERSERR